MDINGERIAAFSFLFTSNVWATFEQHCINNFCFSFVICHATGIWQWFTYTQEMVRKSESVTNEVQNFALTGRVKY